MLNIKDKVVTINPSKSYHDRYADCILTNYKHDTMTIIILSNTRDVRLVLPKILDRLILCTIEPNTSVTVLNSKLEINEYYEYCTTVNFNKRIINNYMNVWSCMHRVCRTFNSILPYISTNLPNNIDTLILNIDNDECISIPKQIKYLVFDSDEES